MARCAFEHRAVRMETRYRDAWPVRRRISPAVTSTRLASDPKRSRDRDVRGFAARGAPVCGRVTGIVAGATPPPVPVAAGRAVLTVAATLAVGAVVADVVVAVAAAVGAVAAAGAAPVAPVVGADTTSQPTPAPPKGCITLPSANVAGVAFRVAAGGDEGGVLKIASSAFASLPL